MSFVSSIFGGGGGSSYNGGTAGTGGDGVVVVRTPAFSFSVASGVWSMKAQFDAKTAGQWPTS